MNAHTGEKPVQWTEEGLTRAFSGCGDVTFYAAYYGDATQEKVLLVYSEGLCRTNEIGRTVLPELERTYAEKGGFFGSKGAFSGRLPLKPAAPDFDRLAANVFNGELLLLFEHRQRICVLNIDDKPSRSPMDSNTEISIKGPRDCFVEDLMINIALIRKRFRNTSLQVEFDTAGRRSHTRIGLLYVRDITSPVLLEELRRRLSRIDTDSIYSTAHLEELLTASKFKIMPMMDFTGRPDYAVNSLLAGRAVLIVDGLPMVLIAPAGISLILKSPEDAHFNYVYVSFARIIRALCFFLSIFLPAIWVALVAFHQDQIPFRLLATISITRIGLPFSAAMEMFLLLTLLEIFREAGIRLPNSIGQTLTSIGGLIIGDAAIRAGLVSPSVVVVGAITAVSGVTLVNQTISTQVSIFRLFFFFMAALLGMYGVILGMVLLLGYMGSLQSFGMSYFAPFAPFKANGALLSFLRAPWSYMVKRPSDTHPIDGDRRKEEGE
ncbi:spore germination protein [Paenibacillus sp. IB182496]|uniref:Spore germination protein n=1 Tax=Paenibacillus sabuli TaxID=2772509 RepID=A0A927GRY2_9BACL|nr:spore germination protein [Paenibacillus sabuli]MBD2846134.1 spore germination protein [Paenibacillus sabuli]